MRKPERLDIVSLVAGVAIAALGIAVRLVFIAAAAAGGIGVVVYGAAWLLMPAGEHGDRGRVRVRGDRAALEVALGSALLMASLLLAMRAIGLWISDAVVWPLVLVAV